MRAGLGAIVLMLVVAAASGCEQSDGNRAPASVERRLPIDLYLANLCPGTETPRRLIRKLRRQADVLLREARAHPNWLVEFTFYNDHGDDETRLITIRQLAGEHLDSIKSHPGPCEPELRQELEAVSASGARVGLRLFD
jgi:hypothetical protein